MTDERIADALERIAHTLELLVPPLPVPPPEPQQSDLNDLSSLSLDVLEQVKREIDSWCVREMVVPGSDAYEQRKREAEQQVLLEGGEEAVKLLPWNRK